MRKSTPFGTPPNSDKGQRRSIQKDITKESFRRDSQQSPRDSGVVMNATPPFQRNSLRSSKDFSKASPGISPAGTPSTSTNVIFRKQSRDRLARDSAYESGVQEPLPISNRRSNTNSVTMNLPCNDTEDRLTRHSSLSCKGTKIDFLNDVLNAPSILAPTDNVKQRKVSLPAMPTAPKHQPPKVHGKATSFEVPDCDPKVSTLDFDYGPNWKINIRESQFPDQETTL